MRNGRAGSRADVSGVRGQGGKGRPRRGLLAFVVTSTKIKGSRRERRGQSTQSQCRGAAQAAAPSGADGVASDRKSERPGITWRSDLRSFAAPSAWPTARLPLAAKKVQSRVSSAGSALCLPCVSSSWQVAAAYSLVASAYDDGRLRCPTRAIADRNAMLPHSERPVEGRLRR